MLIVQFAYPWLPIPFAYGGPPPLLRDVIYDWHPNNSGKADPVNEKQHIFLHQF